MLSQISQKRQILSSLFVESKNQNNEWILQNGSRLTENKLVVTSEGTRGKGKIGVWDEEIQTPMHKINKKKDILYSTEKYSHYFVIILNGI